MYIAIAFTDADGTIVSLHQDHDAAKAWLAPWEGRSAMTITRKIAVGEEFGLAIKLHDDTCSISYNRDDYRAMARKAIEAMREPTEAMLEAAGACEVTVAGFEYNYEGYVSEKEATAVWRAMIDAALK